MSKLPKKERRKIGKEIRSERKQFRRAWSCWCWGPYVEK